METTIQVRQHEQFDRSPMWWTVFVIASVGLMCFSFFAPLWSDASLGEGLRSGSNILNTFLVITMVGSYIFLVALDMTRVEVSINESGKVRRGDTLWFDLHDYAGYHAWRHGETLEYMTIMILNEDGYGERYLYIDDSSEVAQLALDHVASILPYSEGVKLHWYEKVQRVCKV